MDAGGQDLGYVQRSNGPKVMSDGVSKTRFMDAGAPEGHMRHVI